MPRFFQVRRQRFPVDMMPRLERFGRYQFVFLRLRDTADRPLHCVVLDLTDRFRMHPYLFPGAWVAPGVACVADGELIELSLPPDREPVPGARGTDWLKVLIS